MSHVIKVKVEFWLKIQIVFQNGLVTIPKFTIRFQKHIEEKNGSHISFGRFTMGGENTPSGSLHYFVSLAG